MLAAVKAAGVKLVYGEMLCFAPKYVRAKRLVEEGALGKVFLVKQSEEHDGPHSPWFWDVNLSGGGVLLDMGCHSIEFARWILDRPAVKSVQASLGRYVHHDRTQGEDHSIVVIGSRVARSAENMGEPAGRRPLRIYGSHGNTSADLITGTRSGRTARPAMVTRSKADTTIGWTFTGFEEEWNYGFPQEMQHFVNVVLGKEPIETGEDDRSPQTIYTAYQSAGEGRRIGGRTSRLRWINPSICG